MHLTQFLNGSLRCLAILELNTSTTKQGMDVFLGHNSSFYSELPFSHVKAIFSLLSSVYLSSYLISSLLHSVLSLGTSLSRPRPMCNAWNKQPMPPLKPQTPSAVWPRPQQGR